MSKLVSKPVNRCMLRDDKCVPVAEDTEWFRDWIGPNSRYTGVLRRKGEGPIVLVAPHGGRIEPRTEEIAGLIASELGCSCCCFCSGHIRKERVGDGKNDKHHVKSHLIDAPGLVNLIGGTEIAVSIHGLSWREKDAVEVGGRHPILRDLLKGALNEAGHAATDPGRIYRAGECRANIVNRCRGGRGVQLEISRKRYRNPGDGPARADLAHAVAAVLKSLMQSAESASSEKRS